MALRPARLMLLALLAGAGIAAATDCSDLTELVVVVDTDLGPGSDIDHVDISVAGQLRSIDFTAETPTPLTLSVQAGSDPNAEVNVEATGKLRDAVVVRATARVRMADGNRRLVHLSLCRSCGAECAAVTETEEFTGALPSAPRCTTGPIATDGGDAGNDADSGPVPDCPGRPDEMVLVRTPDQHRFCIDRAEVSIEAYERFLVSKPNVANQIADCAFNTDFATAAIPESARCGTSVPRLDASTFADLPVVCVDWCDARAYCESVKKHLCGRVGDRVKPLPSTEGTNVNASEWYAACSNGETTVYPYGNADEDLEASCNVGTGSLKGTCNQVRCKTTNGICDMVGNVWEWEDSCEYSAEPTVDGIGCVLRGGSAVGTTEYHRCGRNTATGTFGLIKRGSGRDDVGFRCCADTLK